MERWGGSEVCADMRDSREQFVVIFGNLENVFSLSSQQQTDTQKRIQGQRAGAGDE